MKELTLVKVGGKVLENLSSLESFIEEFIHLPGNKLLVHGGGVLANQLLEKQGIAPKMIEGRRVTDEETLETVTMVYGGLINKKVVANLQQHGLDAVGLTGADGHIVEAVKRPAEPIDYGFAGDVTRINSRLLKTVLNSGFIPVIAPLSMSQEGQILNTNADTMATEIAMSLADEFKVTLIYSFEIRGVMKDVNDSNSLIHQLDFSSYQEMKSNKSIHSGMIPKLDNAFRTVEKTDRTIIAHFSKLREVVSNKSNEYTEIIRK